MNREHALDTLTITDTPYGEGLVHAVATQADHETSEYLDSLLLTLDHLDVHLHGVAHVEVERFLAELPRLDFV